MRQEAFTSGGVNKKGSWRAAAVLAALLSVPIAAQALPVFNRQTGQNCVACHAGGQFPELTPYGRLFKMTGYTIGQRAFPLSVMGVLSYSKVRNTSKADDPTAEFQKNGAPIFASGSVFAAGKITDNIGLFAQMTYDNYAQQATTPEGNAGYFQGHTSADNIDIRWADRFINPTVDDFIVGVSVNNNPSVSDPWNTAPAWMQYVPTSGLTSYQFADANSPYPGLGAGANVAGASAYAFWKKTVYAELGTYQTANKGWSFMSTGINDASTTHLQGGNNPYWRFALSHEWGPHNLMVGTTGAVAHIFDPGSDVSDPGNVGRIKNQGLDAQYQYLLDPHTVTVQVAYMRQKTELSANSIAAAAPPPFFVDPTSLIPVGMPNNENTTNIFRAKATYTYQAKYGGSVSFFNLSGTTDTALQTAGFDATGTGTIVNTAAQSTANVSGNPAQRGETLEAFWLPIQNVRVGAMYTWWNKYNGASTNYNGLGRDAKDNNTLMLYVWGAY